MARCSVPEWWTDMNQRRDDYGYPHEDNPPDREGWTPIDLLLVAVAVTLLLKAFWR